MAQGKTVEELDATLTRTAWVNWMAFMRMNPFGQKVEDMRFMTLRADIHYARDALSFNFGKIMGNKGGTQPRNKPAAAFPIFKRHGMEKPVRDFRDMTQEQIAASMRGFGAIVSGKN